jgi:hypothetical protein
MRSLTLIAALVQLVAVVSLYADQVGSLDRVESYIGPINMLLQFPVSQQVPRSTLLAVTDAQVAAALNSRTGEYVWRYVALAGE